MCLPDVGQFSLIVYWCKTLRTHPVIIVCGDLYMMVVVVLVVELRLAWGPELNTKSMLEINHLMEADSRLMFNMQSCHLLA